MKSETCTEPSKANFINESAKRREISKDAPRDNGGRSLMTLCDTRFGMPI